MSELIDKAIFFATKKHAGQTRRFGSPYILHPLEVAVILSTLTTDEETIAAGILHDTVEDTDTTPDEIREAFGPRVCTLVAGETETSTPGRTSQETWFERKQGSLLKLRNSTDTELKKMWLADKLSNMRSFYREQLEIGDAVWQNLTQKDKTKHAWYYRTIIEYIAELKGTVAYEEFCMLVDRTFGPEE